MCAERRARRVKRAHTALLEVTGRAKTSLSTSLPPEPRPALVPEPLQIGDAGGATGTSGATGRFPGAGRTPCSVAVKRRGRSQHLVAG